MIIFGTRKAGDPCCCLSEAAFDSGFNHWAIARGLGFDFDKAWRQSGVFYWEAEDADLLLEYEFILMSGEKMQLDQRRDAIRVRNATAAKVKQYYAAYMSDLMPYHSRILARECACGIQRLEDDEL